MEPTTRVELVTCRLRIDPVLRMLLCAMDCSRAFWGVFEHSRDRLYRICTVVQDLYSRLNRRFQIG
jgi:hypothetical protein